MCIRDRPVVPHPQALVRGPAAVHHRAARTGGRGGPGLGGGGGNAGGSRSTGAVPHLPVGPARAVPGAHLLPAQRPPGLVVPHVLPAGLGRRPHVRRGSVPPARGARQCALLPRSPGAVRTAGGTVRLRWAVLTTTAGVAVIRRAPAGPSRSAAPPPTTAAPVRVRLRPEPTGSGRSRNHAAGPPLSRPSQRRTGRWVAMSTRTVPQWRLSRKAKSSTPRTSTLPTSGSDRALTSRRSASLPMMRPTADASRDPARPARAGPICVSSPRRSGVQRLCGVVSPTICSTKVTAGQPGFSQRKRRTHNSVTTPVPPTATSLSLRTYRLCARTEL